MFAIHEVFAELFTLQRKKMEQNLQIHFFLALFRLNLISGAPVTRIFRFSSQSYDTF